MRILKDDCTPEEAVKLIRMTPANLAQTRAATADLADALQAETSSIGLPQRSLPSVSLPQTFRGDRVLRTSLLGSRSTNLDLAQLSRIC